MPQLYPGAALVHSIALTDPVSWKKSYQIWHKTTPYDLNNSDSLSVLRFLHNYPKPSNLQPMFASFTRKFDDIFFKDIDPYDSTTEMLKRFFVTTNSDFNHIENLNTHHHDLVSSFKWGYSAVLVRPGDLRFSLQFKQRNVESQSICIRKRGVKTPCRLVPLDGVSGFCEVCSSFMWLTQVCYHTGCVNTYRTARNCMPRGHMRKSQFTDIYSFRFVEYEPVSCYWCEFGLYHQPTECNRLSIALDDLGRCNNCSSYNNFGCSLNTDIQKVVENTPTELGSCEIESEDEERDRVSAHIPLLRVKFSTIDENDDDDHCNDLTIMDVVIKKE